MHDERERVSLVGNIVGRLHNHGVELLLQLGIGTVVKDFGDSMGAQTREVRVYGRRVEEGILGAIGQGVVLSRRPDGSGGDQERRVGEQRVG